MLEALEGSLQIWDASKSSSGEALKAARALKAMISRTRGTGRRRTQLQSSQSTFDQQGYIPQATELTPQGSSQTNSSSPWMTDSSISFQQPGGMDVDLTMYPVVDDFINAAPVELNWVTCYKSISNCKYTRTQTDLLTRIFGIITSNPTTLFPRCGILTTDHSMLSPCPTRAAWLTCRDHN
jgi:hypothetical protein